MIKATTAVYPPVVENIPEEFTERRQWVCWRLEEREGKQTKVPYIAGTNRRASSTDLMTWRTFDQALAAYEAGEPPYDGIGFVFCSADPFVGVDLDDCRDPESGEIADWAQKIIDSFTNIVLLEVSPSGRGVHLITKGVCKNGVNTKSVEVYGQDRFFTVTGAAI